MVEMACQTLMAAMMYNLLRPVSRTVASLALCLNLVGCTIKTLSRLFYIAPLIVLSGSDYLAAFNAEQMQALALLLIQINDRAAGIALPFFGIATMLNGFLVFRSMFLPRWLGAMSMLAGLGWALYLVPPVADQVFTVIVLVALIVSLVQIGWFIVFAVDEPRWQAQNRLTQTGETK